VYTATGGPVVVVEMGQVSGAAPVRVAGLGSEVNTKVLVPEETFDVRIVPTPGHFGGPGGAGMMEVLVPGAGIEEVIIGTKK
jgi:hypothetical protein